MSDPPQNICQELSRLRTDRPQRSKYCVTASHRDASQCGCTLCAAITRATELVFKSKLKDNENLRIFVEVTDRRLRVGLTLYGKMHEILALDDSIDHIAKGTLISGYTGSADAYRTAAKWMGNCLSTHTKLCSRSFSDGRTSFLPRRILDVRNRQVRLHETDGSQQDLYATLSHCWGGQEPLKTTSRTLSTHLQAIPWDSISKTFQEAIVVTRRLSIPFLWIDCLCIIQDDYHDWQRESADMANIYRNSLLTIAASRSTGPTHGLFSVANPEYVCQNLYDNANDTQHVYCRKMLPHSTNEPLQLRGWALQERLLSRRILHFTEHELIWECLEDQDCECSGMRSRWDPRAHITKQILRAVSLQEVVGDWYNAISEYSRLALTYESDILPAMSGIAKHVSHLTGSDSKYLAGIWMNSFQRDSCWYTTFSRMAARPSAWRAPSFSWASVLHDSLGRQEPIVYTYSDYYNYFQLEIVEIDACTVLDADCVLAGIDETGQVTSGYIEISGLVIETVVMLEEESWYVDGKSLGEAKKRYEFFPDYNYEKPGPYHVASGSLVYCLKLFSTKWPTTLRDKPSATFLVLRKLERGDFERIGFWGVAEVSDAENRFLEDPKHKDTVVRIV